MRILLPVVLTLSVSFAPLAIAQPAPGPPPGGARPAGPAETGPPPTEGQVVAALKARCDSLAASGAFSGVALLQRGGRTLFQRAAGMASRESGVPNTMDTRFNLGSLNKIFTHVALEQLAQAGRLSLDDPVTRWLPDYKVTNAGRITLRLLLEHRGGVPDMLMSPAYRSDPGRVRAMADWFALVRDAPLRFEPGERFEYSNGGFVLLGRVIEEASGEDYYAYVRRHVYAPAGMAGASHVASDSLGRDDAVGYAHPGRAGVPGPDLSAPVAPNDRWLPGRGSSAGGGYATAADLARFADALRTGALLDSAHVRDVFGGQFSLGIAGGSPGVNGLFVVAGPWTLVVLANLDPPAAEQFTPVSRLMRRAAGIVPPQP